MYPRGFRLMEPLSRAVSAIIPSRIDANHSNVPIMLEFALHFYEHLAKSTIDLHVSEAFWEQNTLRRQMNDTLLQILQFDLLNRGDFFPLAYHFGEQANENEEQVNNCEADELYFRQMLADCKRRENAMLQS